ncbi:cholecystokinin receptor type A-like [Rhopilema esculentum]|uniref:cholecystokinin receptor type A-like n=1 Tax=Rhopilema esculentum TaxID=499914 RepID=UPI0031D64C62|eukprot:gene16972-8474_t
MDTISYVSLSVFYGLTIIIGCVLNFVILIRIMSKKSFRIKHANLFLVSLCLSDMFTCAYSITYHLVHLHPAIYSSYLSTTYCRVTQYFVYALAFVSTLSLTAVCIERYLAITKPFFYASSKMATLCYIMLLLPWIHSFVTSIPVLVLPVVSITNYTGFPCGFVSTWEAQQIYMVLVPMNILLPFICIVFSCIAVFNVARKQLHSIKALTPSALNQTTKEAMAESHTSDSVDIVRLKTNAERDRANRKNVTKRFDKGNFREETRIAFATLAVAIGVLFAWMPYLVTRLLYLIGIELDDSLHLFGTAFTLANSAWNPILLLAVRKDLRKSVLSLFRKSQI